LAIAIVLLVAILALAFVPQVWVRRVIAQHAGHRPDIADTGATLARTLLDRMGLSHVKVEKTELGDHYDPEAKAVRLLEANHDGHSLSAIVIAAHEVGHAMQDATGYGPLAARTRLAKQAIRFEKIGVIVMIAAPLVMILAKSPMILALELLAGLFIMSFAILIHAVTLPVELDASFRRALPLLEKAGMLQPDDRPAARQILRAAALTYVAAAAMSLLDVARWLRVLRL
jgi:Zn-dependent membrane protease YugP